MENGHDFVKNSILFFPDPDRLSPFSPNFFFQSGKGHSKFQYFFFSQNFHNCMNTGNMLYKIQGYATAELSKLDLALLCNTGR